MAELVERGQGRAPRALSEVNAETLRAANAVHPIAALQSEWSLFTRELEREIVPTARELGVGIVPYSPLGRGELTGASSTSALDDDFRRNSPRFQEGNRERNLELRRAGRARSPSGGGCTPAQLALAWLLAPGRGRRADPRHQRVPAASRRTPRPSDIELTDEQLRGARGGVPARRHRRATATPTWRPSSS